MWINKLHPYCQKQANNSRCSFLVCRDGLKNAKYHSVGKKVLEKSVAIGHWDNSEFWRKARPGLQVLTHFVIMNNPLTVFPPVSMNLNNASLRIRKRVRISLSKNSMSMQGWPSHLLEKPKERERDRERKHIFSKLFQLSFSSRYYSVSP